MRTIYLTPTNWCMFKMNDGLGRACVLGHLTNALEEQSLFTRFMWAVYLTIRWRTSRKITELNDNLRLPISYRFFLINHIIKRRGVQFNVDALHPQFRNVGALFSVTPPPPSSLYVHVRKAA